MYTFRRQALMTAMRRYAPVRCAPVLLNSYYTDFLLTENPMSEGGVWSNINTGVYWNTFQTASGNAYGLGYDPTTYKDNYAYLANYSFGPDQAVTCVIDIDTVAAASWTTSHEFEIHLRALEGSGTYRCYELSLPYQGGGSIIRWNGGQGSFTDITATSSSNGAVAPGDIIYGEIVGSNITFKHNGVTIATATDSTFTTGNPGIGSFNRDASGSGSNSKFWFRSFNAVTL